MAAASETGEQNPVKRKVSAGLPNRVRPIKRRAARACQTCRFRKVRCDVVDSGSPCNNCRLDQIQCIVSASRRKRKLRSNGEGGRSAVSSMAELDFGDSKSRSNHNDNRFDLSSTSWYPDDSFFDPSTSNTIELNLDHHVPHMLYRTQGHRLSQEERIRRNSLGAVQSLQRLYLERESPSIAKRTAPMPTSEATISLPPYIRPLPPILAADDIAFLKKKGSFLLPEENIRNALLRSYVEYVHPYMPILDLEHFLGAIANADGIGEGISLLLLQAVLFAGSAFVDMRYLLNAGFSDRSEARRTFFHHTKLLYNFDYECDQISLVQSLLLMTCCYEPHGNGKDMWHWMGIALSLAQTIGLHRDPQGLPMESKKKSLRKRIWWTCFMRDRLIALEMRRPTRIKVEDTNVPMLALEDFDLGVLSLRVHEMLSQCPLIRDPIQMEQLAMMCIERAQLCVSLRNVLPTHCAVHSHDRLPESPTASHEADECASHGTALPFNMDNSKLSEINLDSETDGNFNIEAQWGSLAEEEEEGKTSPLDIGTNEQGIDGDWKPFRVLSDSGTQSSFFPLRLHDDRITGMNIPIDGVERSPSNISPIRTF